MCTGKQPSVRSLAKKAGKVRLGVEAGVLEAAACSNGSVPVIETVEVVRKTCEDVVR